MARNGVFALSLGLSTIIHLSMVTVFSIVIFFPREDIAYYSFNIIDVESDNFDVSIFRQQLRVPSAENVLNGDERGILDEVDLWSSLPPIELPTLEFAQHRRLRLGEKGIRLGAEFNELLDRRPDTWARFTDELQSIGSALSRLNLRDSEVIAEPELSPVSHPAPGYAAYITWMSGPRDRQLLSAPPINALWKMSPGGFTENISLIFKVNPAGKVIDVLAPLEDDDGVVADTGIALLKYRFAPLDSDSDIIQEGTLLIRSEETN